jgi:D-alanyl-lipoteichoic acid acyltransferase DltB (MBOAT superfamily)
VSLIDRLPLLPLIIVFLLYPVVAKPILGFAPQRWSMGLFAALNVLFAQVLILAETAYNAVTSSTNVSLYLKTATLAFLVYFVFVVANFALLRVCEGRSETWEWVAFLFPLLFVALVKYWPAKDAPMGALLNQLGDAQWSDFLVGISYMAFRLTLLLREVRNEAAPQPSLAEYLAFAFFIPTMTLGPINSYRNMQRSLAGEMDFRGVAKDAWLRILIGLTKYLFIATLLNQLTYSGLLLDGHPHALIDLVIAVPAYTLYLYCNFSGFCDMVIGVSALLGIKVSENFDRPFAARNLQEFWTRWHITLSSWFRDMMFTPMLKTLVRIFGPKSTNWATAITIVTVFLVLGVWHGRGWGFLMFGLLQGLGVATVNFYRLTLKRLQSREKFVAYHNSRALRLVGSALTFAYFSVSLFFFANSVEDMRTILHALA